MASISAQSNAVRALCLGRLATAVTFSQVVARFLGAVAQLVEHLLCKKNAQSAVLNSGTRRTPKSEPRRIRCSSIPGLGPSGATG
jgi:hypothetical protein